MEDVEYLSKSSVQFEIEDVVTLHGELRKILAPRTVDRILAVLPIMSRIHLWKEEAYFTINAKIGPEKAITECKAGDIAYWPQGDAICLFFQDMVPYSKVNPIGKITHENLEEVFTKLRSGMMIKMHQI